MNLRQLYITRSKIIASTSLIFLAGGTVRDDRTFDSLMIPTKAFACWVCHSYFCDAGSSGACDRSPRSMRFADSTVKRKPGGWRGQLESRSLDSARVGGAIVIVNGAPRESSHRRRGNCRPCHCPPDRLSISSRSNSCAGKGARARTSSDWPQQRSIALRSLLQAWIAEG